MRGLGHSGQGVAHIQSSRDLLIADQAAQLEKGTRSGEGADAQRVQEIGKESDADIEQRRLASRLAYASARWTQTKRYPSVKMPRPINRAVFIRIARVYLECRARRIERAETCGSRWRSMFPSRGRLAGSLRVRRNATELSSPARRSCTMGITGAFERHPIALSP